MQHDDIYNPGGRKKKGRAAPDEIKTKPKFLFEPGVIMRETQYDSNRMSLFLVMKPQWLDSFHNTKVHTAALLGGKT